MGGSRGRHRASRRSPTIAIGPIRQYFWAHDNRHLVYLQDTGGDENWHVHVIDLESGEHRNVTPFDDVQAQVIGGIAAAPR